MNKDVERRAWQEVESTIDTALRTLNTADSQAQKLSFYLGLSIQEVVRKVEPILEGVRARLFYLEKNSDETAD